MGAYEAHFGRHKKAVKSFWESQGSEARCVWPFRVRRQSCRQEPVKGSGGQKAGRKIEREVSQGLQGEVQSIIGVKAVSHMKLAI